MATIHSPARRLILAGGFAAAIAAAPAIAAFAAPAVGSPSPSVAACPNGESTDVYTGVCVPDLVPNSPFASTPGDPSLPQIDGIPCTGANSGQCIGLAEDAPAPMEQPRTSISSSP